MDLHVSVELYIYMYTLNRNNLIPSSTLQIIAIRKNVWELERV